MKNLKFNNNKIGQKQKVKLQNLIMIFSSIIIGLGSVFVLAYIPEIYTGLDNSIQTIERIIVSIDGTDNEATRLFDINTGTKIKLYKDKLSWDEAIDLTGVEKILGIDDNGEIIFILKTLIDGSELLTGPAGPDGPDGPAGATGATGINGINGVQGPAGPAGPMGPDGPDGPDGNNGNDGPTGPQGVDGPAGPTGQIGATGESTSITGATGPQGSTGSIQAGIMGATPFWNGSSRTTTDTNIYNMGSDISIGNPIPVSQGVKLNVNGTLQISNPGNTLCNANYRGSIRFLNQCFQGCNESGRIDLGGTGCGSPLPPPPTCGRGISLRGGACQRNQ
ncbi:MAG: hypothetical protein WAZ12_04400 [Candidatus Absconditicoccaceae bacterium]